MAVANEAIVIEVTATDTLSPKLKQDEKAVDQFANKAKQSFDKAGSAAKKMGEASELVTRRLASLGKAAAGIFTADVLAKVLGFGGAMDLVRKASDAFSTSIRDSIPGLAEWQDRIRLGEEKVLKLRDALKRLRDEQNADVQTFGVGDYKFSFNAATLGSSRAPGSPLDQALTIANRAQTELERLNRKRVGIEDSKALGTPAYKEVLQDMRLTVNLAESQIQSLKLEAAASTSAYEAHKRYNDELQRGNNIRSASRDGIGLLGIAANGLARGAQGVGRFLGRVGTGGLDALGLPSNYAMQQSGGTGLLGVFGPAAMRAGLDKLDLFARAGTGGRRAIGALDDQYRIDNARGGTGVIGPAVSALVSGVQALGSAMVSTAASARTFGSQVSSAFEQITHSVKESLGAEVVYASFNSLRGFFNDIVTGAVKGGEALRRFGQSVVSAGADILSQRLALNVMGFFGFGGTSAARGAVFSGGIRSFASGGMAYGPQLAMIGDNPNRQEAVLPVERGADGVMGVRAMGGGGGSTINIRIDAVDGASVLRIMPQIEAALLQSAGTGQNWRLRQAWGMR